MKLSITRWRDLATVLDSIPPKDLPTTADIRKCNGAVEQIRSTIKEFKQFDELQDGAMKAMKPYQDKLRALDPKSEEAKELTDTANKKLEPHNKKIADLIKKFSETIVEVDLDENYKSFIKTNWEEKIRPQYNDKKALLETADVFNI